MKELEPIVWDDSQVLAGTGLSEKKKDNCCSSSFRLTEFTHFRDGAFARRGTGSLITSYG
jgi:hypothetical protein